ncbi:hypothetical protein myaer102_14910 [Microcystis viridis NIES-102]|uniref:Transposase n=1 Tax=Microcystis viridis NIES-102 TaxID=213615 RepID=A0A3G9K1Y3_MICVR|nr:hypothetical protein myaer102_14910 [Microcystis viridis NIES-102]
MIEIQGKLLVAMRGDRSRQSAKKLWASLPGVYRQCAVAYTDFWESYKTVIPSKRHRPVGKETGQTNPIERLNNTGSSVFVMQWTGVIRDGTLI